MWSDLEHKVNKINWSKSKCNHIMGLKAFVVACAEINSMKDLKALYTSGESSMTIDEIIDAILDKKSGYLKGLGHGPKVDTTRATHRRATELEDSLKKLKVEAATIRHNLQK
ncbi:hypothetical protein BC332_28288 [Capsicum chinense]|nr:hypothetical protein BC332_28288 [Capsicum chinense]